MFSLDVPKDVRNVQAKFIGPFTFRQTIWGLIGGACAYLSIGVNKAIFGPEAEMNPGLLFVFCIIPAFIGFIPLQEMPAEKYFKYIIKYYTTPIKAKYFVDSSLKRDIKKLADAQEAEEKKLKEQAMKADSSFRKSEIRKEKERLKRIRSEEKQYDEEFEKLA